MAIAARFVPNVTKRSGPTAKNAFTSQNVMDIIAGQGTANRATVGANKQGPLKTGYVTAATAAQNAQNALARRMAFATPVSVTPAPRPGPGPASSPIINETPITAQPVGEPVVVDEAFEPAPVDTTPAAPTPYNVYDDPAYQQALAQAQSQFNLDRAAALANMQYEQRPIQRQLEERIPAAEAERRRLAGNFARRGMAGGRYGALTRAEAEVNAREIGLRTGLREQIAELTRQFTANFGAEGTDWLGTRRGYEAQQAAIQAALQNRLAGLTTVG